MAIRCRLEEPMSLELLRNRVVKLQTVFLAITFMLLIVIVATNLAAIYIHKAEDHGALIVIKDFANVTYMDYSNLASLHYSVMRKYRNDIYFDFWAPDATFAAYSEQDLDEFLDFARHYPFAPYSLEDHDCDDFAAELHGLEVSMWI